MKKKEFSKKLLLSKRTISNLSNHKLSKIVGGSNGCAGDVLMRTQDEPLDNGSLLKDDCYVQPDTDTEVDPDYN